MSLLWVIVLACIFLELYIYMPPVLRLNTPPPYYCIQSPSETYVYHLSTVVCTWKTTSWSSYISKSDIYSMQFCSVLPHRSALKRQKPAETCMLIYFTWAEKKGTRKCCSRHLTSDLILGFIRFVPKEILYFLAVKEKFLKWVFNSHQLVHPAADTHLFPVIFALTYLAVQVGSQRV